MQTQSTESHKMVDAYDLVDQVDAFDEELDALIQRSTEQKRDIQRTMDALDDLEAEISSDASNEQASGEA